MTTIDNHVQLTLELAEGLLSDYLNSTTMVKLSLLHKLAQGLEFLTDRELGVRLTLDNVLVKGERPLITEVVRFESAKVSMSHYSNLTAELLTAGACQTVKAMTIDHLRGVYPDWLSSVHEFIVNLETESISAVCQHKVFNGITSPGSTVDKPTSPQISTPLHPSHRDAMKFIVYWTTGYDPGISTEFMFLSIDIYHRIGHRLAGLDFPNLLIHSLVCVWIASKLLNLTATMSANQALVKLVPLVPQLNSEFLGIADLITHLGPKLLMIEPQIVGWLGGALNKNALYRTCQTVEHLRAAFGQIIMNRDPGLYMKVNPVEWIKTVPPGDARDKIYYRIQE